MRQFTNVNNDKYKRVLNLPESMHLRFRKVTTERITVVKFGMNKSVSGGK